MSRKHAAFLNDVGNGTNVFFFSRKLCCLPTWNIEWLCYAETSIVVNMIIIVFLKIYLMFENNLKIIYI